MSIELVGETFSLVNQYFDGVYVLNLEQRTDRKAEMMERLAGLGVSAQFVAAVNGYDFHNRLEYETYLQQPPGAGDSRELALGRKLIENVGSWGCLKSYCHIIEGAKEEGRQRILCLEDDAVFHNDFEHLFQRAVQSIPDNWKLLYLGASQRNWDVPESLEYPQIPTPETGSAPPFYFPKKTFGTFAIGIHSSVYDLMLREIRKMTSPIDNGPVKAVFAAYPQQCFVLNPNLVIADVSNSDIRGSRSQTELAERLRWNLQDYNFSRIKDGLCRPSAASERLFTMRRSNYRQHRNILIEESRAIFLAIPKTGCSSLKAQLVEPLGMEPGDDLAVNLHHPEHYAFPFADQYALNTDYSAYFKFALVRNPWDRLVSCFRDKIRSPDCNDPGYTNGVAMPLQRFDGTFFGGMSFREFVDAVCALPDSVADNHFRSQLYQLTDVQGNLLVNYIGRFESMQASLGEINEKTGLRLSAEIHLNKSGNGESFRDYYDSGLVEKVRKRYFADIHFLQYKFDKEELSPIGFIDATWQDHFSTANVLSFFQNEKFHTLNRELISTAKQNEALQRRVKNLTRNVRRRDKEIMRLKRSLSWRITTPVRKLVLAWKSGNKE